MLHRYTNEPRSGVTGRREKATRWVMALYAISTALFIFIYSEYSGIKWAYMGLSDNLHAWRLAAGLFVLTLIVPFLPRDHAPRSFFLHCLVLLYVMPSVVLFGYNDFPILGLMCVIGSTFIIYGISGARISLPTTRPLNLKVYVFGTIASTALLIIVLGALGGLRSVNLNLSDVYELRGKASANLPAIFGYILPTFTKTIIPFGIAASLYYRYRNFAIILVISSIMLFGVTSAKIVLFAPIVVAFVYIVISRYNPVLALAGGVSLILASIAGAISIYAFIPATSFWGWVESMIVWRSLIVPGYLDYNYIEFFAENAKYYWSDSQITLGLLQNPYDGLNIANLIGNVAFNNQSLQANTGFIGSGFAQAGIVGVMLYAVGVGIILSIINNSAKTLGSPFAISASITLVLTMFMSTDFVGMFLTHGLLIAILLLLTLKPASAKRYGATAKKKRAHSRCIRRA